MTLSIVLFLAGSCAAQAPTAPDAGEIVGAWFEQQVASKILDQPVGLGTIADFNLPDHFVRRLADRELIASYHWQFHRVFDDTQGVSAPLLPPRLPARPDAPLVVEAGLVQVHRTSVPAAQLARRQTMVEDRPALRGFRASVLNAGDESWPIAISDDAPRSMREAARIVAQRLARDKLPRTVATVIDILGAARFLDADDAALSELRAVGIPVDLLAFYWFPPDAAGGAAFVGRLAQAVSEDPGDTLDELLKTAHFAFKPTAKTFVIADETGQSDFDLLRLQLPVGRFYKGPGDGNPIDIAQQLLKHAPECSLLLSVQEDDLDTLLQTMNGWSRAEQQRIRVVAEPLDVGQWAQDGAKAGSVQSGAARILATIVPRYASRRDDGAEFIPGDSFLVDGLAQAGQHVFQSPLLFQGGNLLSVRHPTTKRHVLLLGEPELYRNMAMGLGMSEVLEAFRVEFGVDQVIVVPMVSFHMDYDLNVRAHRERLVAFVNDDRAAVRIILEQGLVALEAGGYMSSDDTQRLTHDLQGGDHKLFLTEIGKVVYGQAARRGLYPLSLARHFAVDNRDSAVGNLQRFLLALEMLAAETLSAEQLPRDPQSQAYFRALQRRRVHRRELHQQIRNLGWWVITVPSLPMAEQSITTINGLHDQQRYYMPAWGGLYAPLDEAARRKFQSYLGQRVQVVPIYTSESQRRSGALHCSVVAHPEIND